MLRVLQVLPSLNVGGVERVTVDVAKGLKETFPACPTYVASAGGSLVPQLQEYGIEPILLPALAEKTPHAILKNAFRLVSVIRKHQIQVIHARSRAPGWSALLASKITKTPLVTTYHGIYSGTCWPKIFYNSIMARGERVIAISRFLYQHLQDTYHLSEPRLQLVYEGIDTDFFSPDRVQEPEALSFRQRYDLKPDNQLILLPGRFVKHKGHHTVLKSLALLQNPLVHVMFLSDNGARSYQDDLLLLCKNLEISEQVHFVTQAVPMNLAYAAADIVVMPSLKPETFGRVIAEAGAMEKLVIATDLGAAPELCLDQQTGFIVPPDDPEALAQAMRSFLALPCNKRNLMEKAARAHVVKNFSVQRMIAETIAIYQSLI